MVVLRTPRLVLRPLTADDAEAIFVARGDPEVCRYWSSPAHQTVTQTRQALREAEAAADSATWAITVVGSDEALGWVTLRHLRAGVDEVGYILRRAAWGQGYATEAVGGALEHAFEQRGKHRVSADIDPRNEASIRVVERLGFVREGLLRDNWLVNGERCDSVIYGLLVERWRAGLDGGSSPR